MINLTNIVVLFTGISLLLYVVLGGADFGAGIIEIFTGHKVEKSISKAIAPVWEANHIWIIVVIVILFNAFPGVYSTITLYLHIPLMLTLIGIIFRGTAFAFRYYDPFEDRSHTIYTFIFKLFSLLTPFFLGITLGAVILGHITTNPDSSFYYAFIAPWFNLFSITLGVFMIVLFAFIASVYLSGEQEVGEIKSVFRTYAKRLLILLIIFGVIVFMAAEYYTLDLFRRFLHSPVSLGCIIIALLLLPFFLVALNKEKILLTRLLTGAQAAVILTGWFGIQYPILVLIKDAEPLTINNSAAPEKTLLLLIIALCVGLALVIPMLVFLFKIFKFSKENSEAIPR